MALGSNTSSVPQTMSFTIAEYAELRPYLYHVTARENLPRLHRTRRVDPAAELMRAAGRTDLLRTRRPGPVTILVDGDPVVLKDQRPLIEANVSPTDGWDFGDLVQFLNERVFFWPGDALGPVLAGRRLLAHYEEDLPAVLRIPLMDLVAINPEGPPLFSPYNTGAPRMQRGRPVRRGPDIFRPAHEARRRRFEVVEVAFRGSLKLPDTVQVPGPPERWVSIDAAGT
jgi:hypothetical protein